jgi:hypothetical protein
MLDIVVDFDAGEIVQVPQTHLLQYSRDLCVCMYVDLYVDVYDGILIVDKFSQVSVRQYYIFLWQIIHNVTIVQLSASIKFSFKHTKPIPPLLPFVFVFDLDSFDFDSSPCNPRAARPVSLPASPSSSSSTRMRRPTSPWFASGSRRVGNLVGVKGSKVVGGNSTSNSRS